jgi:serine/threonine-protein phosphatase PP1-1
MEGFKYHFKEKDVVTVWSAPNYCYRCGIVASVMKVESDLIPKFSIFNAVTDENIRMQGQHQQKSQRNEYFL